MTPLQENINDAVKKISDYLSANPKATSWQLKVKFQLASSVLYLALGQLLAQGKITLEADGINYNITWGTAAVQKQAAEAANPFQPN
jgi:hypothetical protein